MVAEIKTEKVEGAPVYVSPTYNSPGGQRPRRKQRKKRTFDPSEEPGRTQKVQRSDQGGKEDNAQGLPLRPRAGPRGNARCPRTQRRLWGPRPS
jgi:hypothetical protein